jgi:hypothetical protein
VSKPGGRQETPGSELNGALRLIVDELETDIVFGRLLSRERLVEDELVTRFGAKRHIVRQALGELERMGLVNRARNRGAAVADFPMRSSRFTAFGACSRPELPPKLLCRSIPPASETFAPFSARTTARWEAAIRFAPSAPTTISIAPSFLHAAMLISPRQ